MLLQGKVEILNALRSRYIYLWESNGQVLLPVASKDIRSFAEPIDNFMNDLMMQIAPSAARK